MHEAGVVGRDQVLCTGGHCILHFLFAHTNGDGFEFNGERTTKATAGFYIIHFSKLQSFYISEQFAWLFFDTAFAEACAAIMISGFAIEGGAKVFDLEYIDQELRQFKKTFTYIHHFVMKG